MCPRWPSKGEGRRGVAATDGDRHFAHAAAQIDELLKKYPQAKWHQYEPWNWENARQPSPPPGEGTEPPRELHYDFNKAAIIVALDSDFLSSHPASLAYARQFAGARAAGDGMSRLYVAEPTPTITGSMADHRLACGAGEIMQL